MDNVKWINKNTSNKLLHANTVNMENEDNSLLTDRDKGHSITTRSLVFYLHNK